VKFFIEIPSPNKNILQTTDGRTAGSTMPPPPDIGGYIKIDTVGLLIVYLQIAISY